MRRASLTMVGLVGIGVGSWFFLIKQQSTPSDPGQSISRHSKNSPVTCLVYHRFDDDRYPSTNISQALFRKHIKYLKKEGFTFLKFSEAARKRDNNELDQGPYVVVSIDDGYQSFRKSALPVLKSYNVSATLFINTQQVGVTSSYLDWDEIKAIRSEGIEIGNHSHSHAQFLNYPTKEKRVKNFREDLHKAQKTFKAKLNSKPKIYAYPYGEYTPAMQKVLEEADFVAATGQQSGVWSRYSQQFAIPRFPLAGTYGQMERFKDKVAMNPLPVLKATPQKTITEEAKPKLRLLLDTSIIQHKQLNCFINGQNDKCKMTGQLTTKGYEVRIQSGKPLSNRRSKYTVTAPGIDGDQWHWYSKVWVKPHIAENR